MRVTPVPCRIGLIEEACLQDDVHGHVNGVPIGDRENCKRYVKQSQIDLINQLFNAISWIPIGSHSIFIILALHLFADSKSC